MLRTTGSMAPFVSAPACALWKNGVSQPSGHPWPRCANRKRPSFHAADMSVCPAFHANTGCRRAAGRSVPSLNLSGTVLLG
jgi:hypothetical protein